MRNVAETLVLTQCLADVKEWSVVRAFGWLERRLGQANQ
jgi:hypothetical protein